MVLPPRFPHPGAIAAASIDGIPFDLQKTGIGCCGVASLGNDLREPISKTGGKSTSDLKKLGICLLQIPGKVYV